MTNLFKSPYFYLITLAILFLYIHDAAGHTKLIKKFDQIKQVSLYSKILKEERKIRIYVPIDSVSKQILPCTVFAGS